MEMKGVIPKLLNKSVINRDCFKRKVPVLLLNDKNNSKIKAINKNSNIFQKIVHTQNKKTNDFVYQRNKIKKNKLSNGLCMNSNILFSKNKKAISSENNSVISSLKNSSIKNYKNQSHNYDYLESIKKHISGIKCKPNDEYNINKTLTERSIINRFDNGRYGNNFSHSCYNEDVKNNLDFTFDDRHMKDIKPDPEPFPKKYNDCYSAFNKNVCFIPNRKHSYEQIIQTSQRDMNVDMDINSIDVDQKLLFVLKNLKIDNLYQIFINNGIYFRDLFLLSKDDLVEIKIPIGPRNRILYFIKLFNKSAKNYDFEELNNFFKDKKENQKIEAYHNLKKISIPRPSRNINTIAAINSMNEKRKLNRIKNINGSKYRPNLKLSLTSLLYNVKSKPRNDDNFISKKLNGVNIVEHYGCDMSKIKGKPNELIIDEIINNKKKSYSVHLDTFDNNKNANGYYDNVISNRSNINKKEVKNKIKKTKKNNPIPIPKAPRVKSVKYLNKYSPINTNFNYNVKNKKKFFQDSFERIKHNYELFKKNKQKYGNEIYNSFMET